MTESAEEIIAKATDEQVREWHRLFGENVWPPDMPVPREAFEQAWSALHRRQFSLPDKKDGK